MSDIPEEVGSGAMRSNDKKQTWGTLESFQGMGREDVRSECILPFKISLVQPQVRAFFYPDSHAVLLIDPAAFQQTMGGNSYPPLRSCHRLDSVAWIPRVSPRLSCAFVFKTYTACSHPRTQPY